MTNANDLDSLTAQSDWYGKHARSNRTTYFTLQTMQLLFAATIPVVTVAAASETQRWTVAMLGALIGVIEGTLQLGQFHPNWLL